MEIQNVQNLEEITNPVPVDHVAILSTVKQDLGKISCVGYALVWENNTKNPSFGVLTNVDRRSSYPQLYAMRTAIQSCQDTDNLNIITTDTTACNYLMDDPRKGDIETNKCKAIKEELKDMISKRTGTTQIIRKGGKRTMLQKDARFLAKIAYQNEVENQPVQDDQLSTISSYDVDTRSSRRVTKRSSNPIRKPKIMDTLYKFKYKKCTPVDKNEFDTKEDYISLDTTGTIQPLQDRKGKKRAPCSQEVIPPKYHDEHSLVQSIRPLTHLIQDRIRSVEWKNEKNSFLRLNKSIKYDIEQKLIGEDQKLQTILSDYEYNTQNKIKKRRVQNIAAGYIEPPKRLQITLGSSSVAPLSTAKACQTNGISSSNDETDTVSENWIQSLTRWFKK
ncbi:hypothetical protein INT45_001254 [Circinella minor]|uniref:Uncharacterized protein n=1 Tax=Circinella minor TaxID=1195481 RepID=A0A8H7VHV2_9FUNG|nr:hypothetical protein INT45_001254 [Circinella minor]